MSTSAQIYELAIENGCSPRLAEMFAARRPPASRTDREFYAGRPKLDEQFKDPRILTNYVKRARKAGYKPNPNDVYLSQLARFPGDPEAFVSGGRNQIKRVLEKRGWGCEGIVDVKPAQYTPEPKEVPLNPKIIRDSACEMVRKNPDLAKKSKAELSAMVIEKHGPKK
jgi:hypothetical protein